MPSTPAESLAPFQSQDNDDLEKVSKIEDLYNIARDKRRYYHDLWRRNYMLVNSRMWNTFPTTWTPTPTDNEIYPILSSAIAWMTDQEISFNVNPYSQPNEGQYGHLQKLANDLSVILHACSEEYNWIRQIKMMIWDACVYGTGVIKSQWEPALQKGLGDVNIVRIDPWCIYVDPNASDFDDAGYVIEVKKLSWEELQRRYPEHYQLIRYGGYDDTDQDIDSKPSVVNTSSFPLANPGAISPATSATYGLPGQSRRNAIIEPGVFVYECWYKENQHEEITDEHGDDKKVVYPEWRVAVMCQGMLLLDEYAEDLYGVDRHPYSRFVTEDMGEFWGVALATHLAPCQIAINRLLACAQQNAELTGNPIFVEPASAQITKTSIINRPGTRLSFNDKNAGQSRPDWLSPPALPSVIMDLTQFWITRMENIVGLNEIHKGHEPASRTPAKTQDKAMDAGFVRIRSAQANLESCLKDVATVAATLIITNYTVPRMVGITGDKGNGPILKIAAKHFYAPEAGDPKAMSPFRFILNVDAGSDQPTSRQARIAEADTLFAMQAIDQEALLTMHNFPGKDEIVARMQRAKAEAAAQGIMDQGPGKRVRARRTS